VRPQATGSFLRQTGVLTRRYASCLTRDGRTLAVLLAQAPVIALCIGLVLPRDVLGQLGIASFYSVLLSFLLITGAIWLGVTSACREIVKERAIVVRELAAGVRLEAYLAAKVCVLFALAVAQVLLLVLFAVILQPLHQGFGAYVQVTVLLVLVAWVSVAMGLTLSAFARSSDQASSAVPLLLIPQLLFAGAIVPTGLMPGIMRTVSQLTYARWAQAGLGNALQLDQKLSEQVSAVAGYERSFFELSAASAAIALALFTFVLVGAAALALDRRAVS
jgi:ABC-type multidrug transport system permease subunit